MGVQIGGGVAETARMGVGVGLEVADVMAGVEIRSSRSRSRRGGGI